MAVFYCKCKNKIWAEVWWKPEEDKQVWVFFDNDKGSETYGQSVTNCLGCGKPLDRKTLKAA